MTKKEPRLPFLAYVLALSGFAGPFMFSGVAVILPAMGKDLQISGVALSLIEIVYLGAAAAFLLPIGYLADKTDKNTLFKIGSLFYAIATLSIGFFSYVPAIIGFRLLQGLSSGLVIATSIAILTDIVPKEKLGKAIGINTAAAYLGLSAGPFIAGWITTQFGWRWVFHIAFIPLILSYVLIQVNLKSNWKFVKIQFDWLGALLIVASMSLFVCGIVMIKESAIGYFLCASGVLVTVLFFIVENRITNPLLKLNEIKKNRDLSVALITQLLMYAGGFSITFLFSLYLQYVKGLSSQSAGLILFISPVIMVIFSPICGRMADKYSPKRLASLGLFLSFASVLLASQITDVTGIFYLLVILIVQSFGFALFTIPIVAIIMKSVSPQEYTMVAALSAEMRSLGMVFSMMIITIFMSISLGGKMIDGHATEFLFVMRCSFITFAFFGGGGIYLSTKRSKHKTLKHNRA